MVHVNKSIKVWKLATFLSKFGAVGILGTLVFIFLMWIFVEKIGLLPMQATSLSFLIVVIENYVLHYRWTFNSDKCHRRALPQFILMSSTGFIINAGIMYYGLSMLPTVHYFIIQGIALITVILWNLTVSTKWVFATR